MSTRAERTDTMAMYEKEFGAAKGIYLTDFSGITVEKITRLRSEFRRAGGRFLVVKNSLARRALDKCDGTKKDLIAHVKGHTGVALGRNEAVGPSKIIKDFQKENEAKLAVRIAYVDGALYGPQDVKKLADIPPREVLLSQLLGCLQAPMVNVASALNGILVKFVGTVVAVKEKKESEAKA